MILHIAAKIAVVSPVHKRIKQETRKDTGEKINVLYLRYSIVVYSANVLPTK